MTAKDITPSPLVYNGEVITQRDQMISLTDMWRAAGSPANMEPYNWARFEGKGFIEAVAIAHNLSDNQVMTKKRGKSVATFGHWQIAMAYAKYLNPEFHMWCNTVVRERMEGKAVSTAVLSPDVLEMIRRDDGISRMLAHKVTEQGRAIATLVESMSLLVAIVQPATPGVIIRHGKTAGDILKAMGFTNCPKGLAVRVGNWLERAGCRAEGRIDTGTARSRLFDPDKSEAWFKAGGAAAVEREIAERRGQGALALTGQIVRKMPDDIPDGVGAIRVEGELVYFNAADCKLGPGDAAVIVTLDGKIMIDTPEPFGDKARGWMSSKRLEKVAGFSKPVMTQWECTFIGKVIGRRNVVPLRRTAIPGH